MSYQALKYTIDKLSLNDSWEIYYDFVSGSGELGVLNNGLNRARIKNRAKENLFTGIIYDVTDPPVTRPVGTFLVPV